MSFRTLYLRIKALFLRRRLDRDLKEEIEFHLAMASERQVPRHFGNVTAVRERTRQIWTLGVVEDFWQDLRYAVRVLSKSPGFTAAVVATLGLGIGGTAAMFSALDAVLIRPLPYPQPESLIAISERHEKWGKQDVSWWNFVDWRAQSKTIGQMAAAQGTIFNLTGAGEPERLIGANVSAEFFSILGASPAVGRLFGPLDDRKGAAPVVVLSNSFWRRKLHADPNVAGRALTFNGFKYTIAGVLTSDFRYLYSLDVFAPIVLSANEMGGRASHPGIEVIARIKPGFTLDQVRREMRVISLRLAREYPATNTGESAMLAPLRDNFFATFDKPLLLLSGAVLFVLLIACANAASLSMARSALRAREIAVRTAIGASRWRVARQMLTESALLALAGAAAGLLIAYGSIHGLTVFIPENLKQFRSIDVNTRVLLFALLTATVTAFLFGLAPALGGTRIDVQNCLNGAGRSLTGNPKLRQVRQLLVISEVALAVILLIGCGLLLRSLENLQRTDLGFRPDHILTIPINAVPARYSDEQRLALYAKLYARLEASPGVKSTGRGQCLPLQGNECWWQPFSIEGRPTGTLDTLPTADFNLADGGYFDTLGIPLLRGRLFNEHDVKTSTPVALINQEMAHRFWPKENPIGKRIKPGRSPLLTIVGVVGNAKRRSIEGEMHPEAYYAATQWGGGTKLVIRTTVAPAAFIETLRRIIRELDPDMAVHDVRSMDYFVEQATTPKRLPAILLTAFGAIALFLAAIGVYGLISYLVTQRTQEIGVRIALGARRVDVIHAVIRTGLRLAAPGICIGLLGAAGLTRLMDSLLYGVSATDLGVFAAVSVLLLAICLLASFLPARRAARLDPMVALRCD